jgi:uncharacterized protein YndB with AHSA1/START domain
VTAPFRFDSTWQFATPVERLWEVLSDTAAYPVWWSWLHDYEPAPLQSGAVAAFRIRPPLPYALRVRVTVDEVVAGARVVTTVSGDVGGPARLEVAATEGGSQARLVWQLDVRHPLLARLQPIVRPVMLWGHDRVVAAGVRQFERRALRTAPA